jgi:hypothetical protein
LVAVFVVVDLLLARRLFDDRFIPFPQKPPLKVEDVVVHINDISVGHRRDAGTYGDGAPETVA